MIRQFIGRAFRGMWYVIDYLDDLPEGQLIAVIVGGGMIVIIIIGLIVALRKHLKKRG